MASRRTQAPKKVCVKRNTVPYKGIRMRAWGRWVSEIRVPNTKQRIWLGSYETPEKAARAYDAALYCFHGPESGFNFPFERRPELPFGLACSLSKDDIKALAASFAARDPSMTPLSSVTTQASLNMPVLPDLLVSGEIGGSANVVGGGESFAPAGMMGASSVLPENVEFDDFMLDIEWMEGLF